MEKKICEICANEFETENIEETLCEDCKKSLEEEIDNAEALEEVNEEEANEVEEVLEDAEVAEETEEAEESEDYEETSEAEMSADVILSANGEPLTEEEILALEEAEKEKMLKKQKTIKIASIAAGIVALILVVLFVPFKKDKVVEGKRVNLFTCIESAVTFSNDKTAAMSIGGERIDESLFNYFLEGAQYNLMMENLGQQPTEEDVKNFWSKEIDGKNAAEVAKENAQKDIIEFVTAKQKAEKMGITISDEEKKSLDNYMNSYITDDFLEQMKLTKNQVRYILEGSSLTNALAQKIIAEDEKYNIPNDKIEAAIKEKGEKISAKHILFNTIDTQTYQPLDEEKKAEVMKKAQETLDKIKAGEDFDTLMNSLSEDPGLASYPDGYTFGKGEMVAPFEEAAFKLEEGKVSELVETDFGIHIIKRIPLTLSENDLQNEKLKMQNELFENDITSWAKGTKIIYNDKLIDELGVIKE